MNIVSPSLYRRSSVISVASGNSGTSSGVVEQQHEQQTNDYNIQVGVGSGGDDYEKGDDDLLGKGVSNTRISLRTSTASLPSVLFSDESFVSPPTVTRGLVSTLSTTVTTGPFGLRHYPTTTTSDNVMDNNNNNNDNDNMVASSSLVSPETSNAAIATMNTTMTSSTAPSSTAGAVSGVSRNSTNVNMQNHGYFYGGLAPCPILMEDDSIRSIITTNTSNSSNHNHNSNSNSNSNSNYTSHTNNRRNQLSDNHPLTNSSLLYEHSSSSSSGVSWKDLVDAAAPSTDFNKGNNDNNNYNNRYDSLTMPPQAPIRRGLSSEYDDDDDEEEDYEVDAHDGDDDDGDEEEKSQVSIVMDYDCGGGEIHPHHLTNSNDTDDEDIDIDVTTCSIDSVSDVDDDHDDHEHHNHPHHHHDTNPGATMYNRSTRTTNNIHRNNNYEKENMEMIDKMYASYHCKNGVDEDFINIVFRKNQILEQEENAEHVDDNENEEDNDDDDDDDEDDEPEEDEVALKERLHKKMLEKFREEVPSYDVDEAAMYEYEDTNLDDSIYNNNNNHNNNHNVNSYDTDDDDDVIFGNTNSNHNNSNNNDISCLSSGGGGGGGNSSGSSHSKNSSSAKKHDTDISSYSTVMYPPMPPDRVARKQRSFCRRYGEGHNALLKSAVMAAMESNDDDDDDDEYDNFNNNTNGGTSSKNNPFSSFRNPRRGSLLNTNSGTESIQSLADAIRNGGGGGNGSSSNRLNNSRKRARRSASAFRNSNTTEDAAAIQNVSTLMETWCMGNTIATSSGSTNTTLQPEPGATTATTSSFPLPFVTTPAKTSPSSSLTRRGGRRGARATIVDTDSILGTTTFNASNTGNGNGVDSWTPSEAGLSLSLSSSRRSDLSSDDTAAGGVASTTSLSSSRKQSNTNHFVRGPLVRRVSRKKSYDGRISDDCCDPDSDEFNTNTNDDDDF